LWNSAAQRHDPTSYSPVRLNIRCADLLRERMAGGRITEAIGREEDYLAARVARRRVPGSPPAILTLADGTSWRIAHYPTRDGGVVAVRTDITETRRRED